MKRHWNSKEIIKSLKEMGFNNIKNDGQGGDWDTDTIRIIIKKQTKNTEEESLFICGFNDGLDEDIVKIPSNCEIEFVELTDGQDSKGGLNSEDYDVAKAYIEIRQMLIKMKYEVVPCMDDYF